MKPIFIAGPCVIESAEVLDKVAERIVDINNRLGTEIIFKASFDKANRTSISSYRGVGIERGLQMLADVKSKWGVKLITDCEITKVRKTDKGLSFFFAQQKSPHAEVELFYHYLICLSRVF